jgi:hypothetical protein
VVTIDWQDELFKNRIENRTKNKFHVGSWISYASTTRESKVSAMEAGTGEGSVALVGAVALMGVRVILRLPIATTGEDAADS